MQTLKEFDYNLWTTEENGIKKYWVGVKATGEVVEVDLEVMRLLRNEEKKLRREIEDQSEMGTLLSLDYVSNDEVAEHWLIDTYRLDEEVATTMLEHDFVKLLTPFQKEIYDCCMKNGMKYVDFARKYHLDSSTVYEARDAIRKKYKKFFFLIPPIFTKKCPLSSERGNSPQIFENIKYPFIKHVTHVNLR